MKSSSPHFRRRKLIAAASCAFAVVIISIAVADERRAAPPKFSSADTEGVFFDNLSDAIRGTRPALSAMRNAQQQAAVAKNPATAAPAKADGPGRWDKLISAESLEAEIKRVAIHFDSIVTTPGAFNSGGYQDARLDLSILAVMFAIINEYGGDVRFKNQAAAARDLIARTAFNCKSGSTQVYNEAKLRKNDLQDIISGGGLSKREAEPENDWSMIVDRSPMMEYLEQLQDGIKETTNSVAKIKSSVDDVKRQAELFTVVSEVLLQEGMDEYDDEDYIALSKSMGEHSMAIVNSLKTDNFDSIRKSVGGITQSCDACHEQYR